MVKTSSDGNLEWSKTFGGANRDHAYSLVQTEDGGYLIAGSIYSFDSGDEECWLIKTDSTGKAQWNETYGGLKQDYLFSAIQTVDKGYAFVGTTRSGDGSPDAWFVKTDKNGKMLWNKTYGGKVSDEVQSIVQTDDEGYALGGTSHSLSANIRVWLIKTWHVPEITYLTLSINNQSPVIGQQMHFAGKLQDAQGNSLNNENITLSLEAGHNKWISWGTDQTDAFGEYSINWTPTENGTFRMKVEYVGNQTLLPSENTTNLVVLQTSPSASIPENIAVYGVSTAIIVTLFVFYISKRKGP